MSDDTKEGVYAPSEAKKLQLKTLAELEESRAMYRDRVDQDRALIRKAERAVGEGSNNWMFIKSLRAWVSKGRSLSAKQASVLHSMIEEVS